MKAIFKTFLASLLVAACILVCVSAQAGNGDVPVEEPPMEESVPVMIVPGVEDETQFDFTPEDVADVTEPTASPDPDNGAGGMPSLAGAMILGQIALAMLG